MAGSRLLPLLTGLWACAALAQGTTTLTPAKSIALDGGGPARAYFVTSGASQYAMANAGQALQVFGPTGAQLPALPGTFSAFTVANGVLVGAGTTTLVAVANGALPACVTTCLDFYYWDPVNNFVFQTRVITNVGTVTAMTIDASMSPFRVYYATSGPQLYEQDVSINGSGAVVAGGSLNRSLPGGQVAGLTFNPPDTLYSSDDNSTLYTFPGTLTNLDGGVFASPPAPCAAGHFCQIEGLFLYANAGVPTLLVGGIGSGVYLLNALVASSTFAYDWQILAPDGGLAHPSAASIDTAADLMLVTEEQPTVPSGPWLHFVYTDAGADAGDAGGVTDAGAGDAGPLDAGPLDAGIPTIPSVPPGPGQPVGTANSCTCSTAGGTPLFLVLLLPLLAPRRRR